MGTPLRVTIHQSIHGIVILGLRDILHLSTNVNRTPREHDPILKSHLTWARRNEGVRDVTEPFTNQVVFAVSASVAEAMGIPELEEGQTIHLELIARPLRKEKS